MFTHSEITNTQLYDDMIIVNHLKIVLRTYEQKGIQRDTILGNFKFYCYKKLVQIKRMS